MGIICRFVDLQALGNRAAAESTLQRRAESAEDEAVSSLAERDKLRAGIMQAERALAKARETR